MMKTLVFTQKQVILTIERHTAHPLAGPNTQQIDLSARTSVKTGLAVLLAQLELQDLLISISLTIKGRSKNLSCLQLDLCLV